MNCGDRKRRTKVGEARGAAPAPSPPSLSQHSGGLAGSRGMPGTQGQLPWVGTEETELTLHEPRSSLHTQFQECDHNNPPEQIPSNADLSTDVREGQGATQIPVSKRPLRLGPLASWVGPGRRRRGLRNESPQRSLPR